MSPTAAGDTTARTPSPSDLDRIPSVEDEPRVRPRPALWRRLSTAVAETHRSAVPF